MNSSRARPHTRGADTGPADPLGGSTPMDEDRRAWRAVLAELVERGGLIILLVLVIIYFGARADTSQVFLSSANIKNILGDQAVVGLIALAMIPPLTAGYFDLSVAATAGVANIAFASAVGPHSASILVGIALAVGLSLAVGLTNGLLVAQLKLNGFVVTLGMATFLGGVATWYTKGSTIAEGIPSEVGAWGSSQTLGLPNPFLLLIGVAAIAWYLLGQVPWGRHLESIGSNEAAARLVGIKVERTLYGSFLLGSTLAAFAGIVLTTRTGSATPTGAPSYLFPAFAAVFLGATVVRPGHYNVFGTVIGVFFVAVSISGLSLAGADIWVQPVFNGAALILAVALSTLIARARASSATRSQRELTRSRQSVDPPAGDGGGLKRV
jgi:ribose transport system permease protein